MPLSVTPAFIATDIDALLAATGRIALIVPPDGKLSPAGRRLDRAMRGGIARAIAGPAWDKLKTADTIEIGWPAGLQAEAVQLVKLQKGAGAVDARKAGAAIGKRLGETGATLVAGTHPQAAEIALGLQLKSYDFGKYRSGEAKPKGAVTVMVDDPAAAGSALGAATARAEGVAFTRDLVNEPANVLNTVEFARRLQGLSDLGIKVEVLEEAALEKLGMRALLGVGQGSSSPSKVVIMEWRGGAADEAPFAMVGKGVCFDSGGISIKPGAGMEDMISDMGGAGVVSGLMKTLALRKARANVVGLVGLVENMPDGKAQRPGDIVTSMKGDTIDVINTDAEGRLVLADVLWYAQERFKPRGMINLATLTGAIVIALGHENAGVFSNDDTLCAALLKAAGAEGEGAWRMPMGPGYDAMIKARFADIKNTGGRPGGAITAAQFLRRFVKDETPWCHIDIAGVAYLSSETDLAPKGATGWGVMTLDRLVRDMLEG